uniref:Uncharacterized protein n=1 Tax=Anguilla anguilla TaxID=7936 RepID=A0A0E9TMY0_ANGAN
MLWTLGILLHLSSMVEGCGVMAGACMAASGTNSVVFIDDATSNGSNRITAEMYRNI